MATAIQDLRQQHAAQQQPPAQRQPTEYERLKHQLERSKGEFMPMFGNNKSNVDAFIRVVLNAVMANPDLLTADRHSLLHSCMRAAQDGLMPDGREAVLNIYNTKVKGSDQREVWVAKVQYLPMVAGYIKMLYESPEVTMVDAAAVYQNDHFVFRRGDDPKLEHVPTLDDEAGPVIAAYLVVKLKSGEIKREVMPKRDIERVRAASKSPNSASSPWMKWYDQQAIKSVIKRGAKQLPRNDRFDKVDRSDNAELGFSATPDRVADAAMRHQAAPALGHSEPITFEFGSSESHREPVHVGGDEGHGEDAPLQQQQHEAEDAGPRIPAFDGDAFAVKLESVLDLDTLDLLGDEIRSITDEDLSATLMEIYRRRRDELSRPSAMEAQPKAAAETGTAAPTAPAAPVRRRPAAGNNPQRSID